MPNELPVSTTNSSFANSLYSFFQYATSDLSGFLIRLALSQPGKTLINLPNVALGLTIWQSNTYKVFLGKEVVAMLEILEPDLNELVNELFRYEKNDKHQLYELIKPHLTALFAKKLTGSWVNLNHTGLQKILTESFIKQEILPYFFIIRDIPKFCNSIKEKEFHKGKKLIDVINDLRLQFIGTLDTHLHSDVRKYLLMDAEGLYEIKDDDPALVSQIKKILNAFVYVERIVLFINSLDLNPDSGFKLLPILEQKGNKKVEFLTKVIWYLAVKDSVVGTYLHFDLEKSKDVSKTELEFIKEIEKTIGYLRKAQTCLLEIDLPVYQLFGKEINFLLQIFQDLDKFRNGDASNFLGNRFAGDTIKFLGDRLANTDKLSHLVANYVGLPAGTLINHLRPDKIDYLLFSKNIGLAPSYLDKLTRLIYEHLTDKPIISSRITPQEKDAYQESAVKLFLALSHYDHSLPILKDYRWISPSVTIVAGAYKQWENTSHAIEEMVVFQLNWFKKEFFTPAICELDKFDLYLGLEFGESTKSHMQILNPIYERLVNIGSLLVDIEKKYPDLAQLNNTSFLFSRLQNILQEQNECEVKIGQSIVAKRNLLQFKTFFNDKKNSFPNITNADKNKMLDMYQTFKCYVIQYNPKLSVLIDELLTRETNSDQFKEVMDQLDDMTNAVSRLCVQEKINYESYFAWAKRQLTAITNQVKGSLYKLDPSKPHSLLIIDEPEYLSKNKPRKNPAHPNPDSKTASLNPIEAQRLNPQKRLSDISHKYIKNLSTLDTADRAKLYKYHLSRSFILNHIAKEIEFFLQEIKKHNNDWFSDRKKIASIATKYRILQPYLVDLISSTPHSSLDEAFIALLNSLPSTKKPNQLASTLNQVKNIMGQLKQLCQRTPLGEIERSKQRSEWFVNENQLYIKSNNLLGDNEQLTRDSELVKRQNKWIRHTKLSDTVDQFDKLLRELMNEFDPCFNISGMATDSVSAVDPYFEDEAPFLEMEDDLKALRVPSQVSWIKRAVNVVYYIKSNFKYLETLARDIQSTASTRYYLSGPLIEGIYQIKPFVDLTKAYQTITELMQEPSAKLFYWKLNTKYQELMKVWYEIQPLYSISPKDVAVVNQDQVKGANLLFPILSVFILPEHLNALSKSEHYDAHIAEPSQQEAEKLSQYIDSIIQQFKVGHYLGLLMQSYHIFFVTIPGLRAKITNLGQEVNRITIEHLKDIQSLLSQFVKEASDIEFKFGLRAGCISQPTQLIINALFNSFIKTLDISLKKQVSLLSNTSSYTERLEINKKIRLVLDTSLTSENKELKEITHFWAQLEHLKSREFLDKPAIFTPEEEQLRTEFGKIYPLLYSQKENYPLALDQRDKSEHLDRFCNWYLDDKRNEAEALEGHVNHFLDIENVLYLVKHVHAANQGTIETLEKRITLLDHQDQEIEKSQRLFLSAEAKKSIDDLIEYIIDKEISRICEQNNATVPLPLYLQMKLLDHLANIKSRILENIRSTSLKELSDNIDEIEKNIYSSLQSPFNLFTPEEEGYKKHISIILVQIKRFESYCEQEDKKYFFENKNTLKAKSKVLGHLKMIANNEELILKNRVNAMKEFASTFDFKKDLLEHDSGLPTTPRMLLRFFMDLVHSIFNFCGWTYHPADFYDSLNKAVHDDHAGLKNLGFFTKNKHPTHSLSLGIGLTSRGIGLTGFDTVPKHNDSVNQLSNPDIAGSDFNPDFS